MILSEGAGAVLLARDGPITIERAHPGGSYRKREGAEEILMQMLRDLQPTRNRLRDLSSANGTFIDQAEQRALEQVIQMQLLTR